MRFIDTSFWFALQDRDDRRNRDASELVRAGIGRAVTTALVLGETWTLLRRRAGHPAAVGFLDRVMRISDLEIEHVGEAAAADAWLWLRQHAERMYSFVDATSFGVMRSRRIREALAFDGDFTAAGFIEVRAASPR